eukprot:CAMPEP_0184859516 /NCGR_PEP_ID=MMETSP0580-20130426/4487_1 /TAXON_ID=1118495 /ORGANISM="Dactyliosolen fragilissimus" /LENGTH=403 /DNA_ID=CAMNT_0027356161 /DNA_START=54 /DNA_END=1265 /DNA_ORIENTATION=-
MTVRQGGNHESKSEKAVVSLLDLNNCERPNKVKTGNFKNITQNPLSPTIVTLSDPFDGQDRQYLLIDNNIIEIHSTPHSSQKYSSYFVGNRVISNGNLHLMNRVDPLYFLLQSLYKNLNCGVNKNSKEILNDKLSKWQPIDQIFSLLPTEVRSTLYLNEESNDIDIKQMKNLFDVSDQFGEDLILYKFDLTKVMVWLSKKYDIVRNTLERIETERKIFSISKCKSNSCPDVIKGSEGGSKGAFSSSFIMEDDIVIKSRDTLNENPIKMSEKSKQQEVSLNASSNLNQKEMLKVHMSAVQIVCQYLNKHLREKFLLYINQRNSSQLRTSEEDLWSKKIDKTNKQVIEVENLQHESQTIFEHGTSITKKSVIEKSAGLKRLMKVNTKGMKNISTFFTSNKKKKIQ